MDTYCNEWYARDRKRERQIKRYGVIWSRQAMNRKDWKRLDEAYVSFDTVNIKPESEVLD